MYLNLTSRPLRYLHTSPDESLKRLLKILSQRANFSASQYNQKIVHLNTSCEKISEHYNTDTYIGQHG